MTFSFGNSNTGSSTFGSSTASTFGTPQNKTSSGSLFGNTTANTGTSLFGNTSSILPSSTSGGGLFGNTSATSNTGGSLFGNTSNNTGGSLFGKSNSGALFGNSTANGGGGGGLFGNTNSSLFNSNQQNNQQQQPHNQLLLTARALSQPQLFGDERDQIVAKFNQVLASWGTGKAYYSRAGECVELTPSNHFCSFKNVGYACLPSAKDSDGLVWIIITKKVGPGGMEKPQLSDAIHAVFNRNPNVTVVIDGMRTLDATKSEVTIYVKEQKADGTSRKLAASELSNGLNQQSVKTQLVTSIGLEEIVGRTALSEDHIKQILDKPPACIDPVIWKQAVHNNPDDKKMIPVPILGFSALHSRLKLQEEMTQAHQNRCDLLHREIREIQDKHSNTKSKIEERKRKLLELAHKILEVIIQQEVHRKTGLAIQTEEEQLRSQLESLNNQLRAPHQFRGRLNELLSSIRMQYEGEVRPNAQHGNGSFDEGTMQAINKHLGNQQAGLKHMVERMKNAFSDLEIIESGLQQDDIRRF